MPEPRKEPFFSTARIEGPASQDFVQKQSTSGEAKPLDTAVFQEGSMTPHQILPREIPQTEFTTFSSCGSDEVFRKDLQVNVAFAERRPFNYRISNEAFINQNHILPYERKYIGHIGFASNIPIGLKRNDRIQEFEVPHEEIPCERTFYPQTSMQGEFNQKDDMQVTEQLYICRMNSNNPVSQDFLLQQSQCNKLGPFATPGFGEEFVEESQHSACNKSGRFATPGFGDGFIEQSQHSACNNLGPFATPGFGERFIEQSQHSACNKLGTFASAGFGEGFNVQGQHSAHHILEPSATPGLDDGFIEQRQELTCNKWSPFASPNFGEGFIEQGQLWPNMTIEERTQVSSTQSVVDFSLDPNFQVEETLVKAKQQNPLISSEVIINQSHVRLHELKHSEEKPHTPIVCKEGMIVRDNLQYSDEKTYRKLESTLKLQGSGLEDNPQQHDMIHASAEKCASWSFSEGYEHQTDNPHCEKAQHTKTHIVSTEHNVRLIPQDHLLLPASAAFQEGQFNCFSCNQRFISKRFLQEHEEIHKHKKSFICNICGTYFVEKTDFLRHSMTHNCERPFPRIECDKGFSTKGSLQRQQCTQTDKYRHKYDLCNYASARTTDLLTHQPTHTRESLYKCDLCDYASARLSTLRIHRRTHTGERPYTCDLCDYTSAQLANLRTHRRKHTGQRPHKCDLCDYTFTHLCYLRSHRRRHTGERPFKCNLCDYAFTQSSALQRHRRTHTGKRP